jgi:hypothetical protein
MLGLEQSLGTIIKCDIVKPRRPTMQSFFIKFSTEEDRAKGFYELARHARIASLPGEVYQVPREALKILEDLHIAYRRATDAEVQSAHDQVRNPSASVL